LIADIKIIHALKGRVGLLQ